MWIRIADDSQVTDVGQALSIMAEDDNTASQTYELYGPENFSMSEIAELVDKEIFKKRRHINLPKRIIQPSAKILNQLLYWKVLSGDEIEREFIDQQIDRTAKTFADLGMEAGNLRNFTFHYLVSSPKTQRKPISNLMRMFLTARISELILLRSPTSNRERA